MLATVDAGIPGLRWRDERDGPNPYAGLLAHAQRIVCTPDSVNMLSEAAATLAPVFVWSTGIASGRLRVFLDALRASGRVRDLDDALAPFAAEPLRETARVADEVRRRLSDAGLQVRNSGQ
jgi:mitochondrial fission protein ELM1